MADFDLAMSATLDGSQAKSEATATATALEGIAKAEDAVATSADRMEKSTAKAARSAVDLSNIEGQLAAVIAAVNTNTTAGAAGFASLSAALKTTATSAATVAASTKTASASAVGLGDAARKAAADEAKLAAEIEKLKLALDPTSAAQRNMATAIDIADTAFKRGAIDAAGYAAALKRAEQIGKGASVSAGAQRAGYVSLGQQLQDVSVQAAAGTSAFTILAQQGGQTASAIANMGGKFSGVAAIIAGPFGSVALAAVAILGNLALAHFNAGKETDKHKTAAQGLAKALDDLDKSTRGAISSARAETNARYNASAALVSQTINTRELTRAKLEQAKANLSAARAGEATGLVTPIPGRGAASQGAIVAGLEKEIAAQGVAIDKAGRVLRQAAIPIYQRQVAEANDKVAAATGRYDRAVISLNDRLAKGKITAAEYRREFDRQADALKAVQDSDKNAAAGKRAHNKEIAAAAKAKREEEAADRKAVAVNNALETSFNRLAQRLDPTTDALRDYRNELAEIAKLLAAGKIDQGQSFLLRSQAEAARDAAIDTARRKDLSEGFQNGGAFTKPIDDYLKKDFTDGLTKALGIGADTFKSELQRAVDLISTAFDGLFGAGGAGQLTAAAGRIRSAQKTADVSKLSTGIDKLARGVGISDAAAASIGKNVGKAFGGAATGAAIADIDKQLGISKALGLKSSRTGAQVGGALGSATGLPGGDIVGSILGSAIGGAFKKTQSGSATITSTTGATTTSGNSRGAIGNASGLAGNVQQGLQSIADALGGGVGAFNVTVGQRHGDYRVTTGSSLKVKNGAQDFNDDAGAAQAAAIRIAITQGAVTGLSAAVQKAIGSSSDIDKALAEALKVKELEDEIGGLGATLKGAFANFDRSAAERVRLAKSYGLDLLAVEKINGEQRAKLVDDTLKSRIGSLQDFLDSVRFGDLAEGSATDRRTALKAQIAAVQGRAEAGEDGAAEQLATLNAQLLAFTRENFGTAGGELSGDKSSAVAGVEKVIAMESERIKAAAGLQEATTAAIEKGNALQDENNMQNAQMITKLDTMASALSYAFSGGSGSSGGRFTARETALV